MSRFDEIAQIYDHRLPPLRSPEVWEQTLRMTSGFWRLNFCEAMLLTLQNPKAEMCGTIDQWNNIGRYIRRGEHSTAVFRSRTDTQLMYLFDVRQTYGKAYNSKWKLSERMADGIVDECNDTYGRERMHKALLLKYPDSGIPGETTVYRVMTAIGITHRPNRINESGP